MRERIAPIKHLQPTLARWYAGIIETDSTRRSIMAVYVSLPGSRRSLLPNSRPAGPANPSEIASLTVRVRSVGDSRALADKAYELAKTPMAQRKYLTHEELERQHGASQEDLDKIEQFA